jgi:hypothetical protein
MVDQLSGTTPNPSFSETATRLLVGYGYTVDYYGPGEVTVGFFRNLPSKGYGLVIIRAHSTGYGPVPGQEVSIFTSEVYTPTRYVYEQLTYQVARASLGSLEEAALGVGPLYFSITPLFVRNSMRGEFPGSIVIMMGCTGLITSEMAEAFVAKGAKVYVSWDGTVTADRTDTATFTLLRLLVGGKTVREAVNEAMELVGIDPVYPSRLGYYPEYDAKQVLGG